jgi:phage terminase large subunit GpA-like protein
MPDRRLALEEWANANITLSSKDSSEPGPYRWQRTPYVREIYQALSPEHPCEQVIMIAGAQLGKTRIGLTFVGYVIDVKPGPMLLVEPTVDLAKKVSKQRLATMIETTEVLRKKVAQARSRDSGNTMFEKEFPGGMLMITGANSAVGLRSMPIKYLFLDEIDGYPQDVDGEGDPAGLAEARTMTFARRKIFKTSTPTIKGLSRIEFEFEQSDKRRFFLSCPHCGFKDWIRWERIQWPEGQPEEARLLCTSCGVLIEERHKATMLAGGEWRPTGTAVNPRVVGFHISTLYAPLGWRPWADIAREFIAAKDDTSKLKKFVNTVLGETWEERGETLDADGLRGRLEGYDAEVPAGVGILTASVDVQGDRLELAVKGWGAGEESWLIALSQIHGDPALTSTWLQLDKELVDSFATAHGRKLVISAVAIDSGGLHTDEVYRFVKARERRQVHGQPQIVRAIKGIGGRGHEILARPSNRNRYQVHLYPVGTDAAKDTVFSRMRIAVPGPGYMHLPSWADGEYLEQLTAEKAVRRYKKGVGAVREYVKVRERNEGLDLEVYALAALYMLGRRVDLQRLAGMASGPPDGASSAPAPGAGQESVVDQLRRAQRTGVANSVNPLAGGKGWIKRW